MPQTTPIPRCLDRICLSVAPIALVRPRHAARHHPHVAAIPHNGSPPLKIRKHHGARPQIILSRGLCCPSNTSTKVIGTRQSQS